MTFPTERSRFRRTPTGFTRGRQSALTGINSQLNSIIESAARRRRERQILSIAQTQLAEIGGLQQQAEARLALAEDMSPIPDAPNPSWVERVGTWLGEPLKRIGKPMLGAALTFEKIHPLTSLLPGIGRGGFPLGRHRFKGEAELIEAVTGGEKGLAGVKNIWAPERAEAIRAALEKTKFPKGVMGAMELIYDPLTIVPAARFGKLGVKAVVGAGTGKRLTGVLGPAAREARTRLPRLPKLGEFTDLILPTNYMARLGERLSKIPHVSKVVGVVNPTVLANTDIGRKVVGWMNLLDVGENLTKIGLGRLTSRAFPFTIKGGMITFAKGVKPAPWGDVFQAPNKFKDVLSVDQMSFIKEYHALVDDAVANLKAAGVDLKEINFEAGEHYVPRIVRGETALDKIRENMTAGLGGKAWFQRTRFYQTMEEGMADGINYLDSPLAVLDAFTRSAYRLMADEALLAEIKPLGQTLRQRVDIMHPGLREQATMVTRKAARLQKFDDLVAGVENKVMPSAGQLQRAIRQDEALGTRLEGILNLRHGRDLRRPNEWKFFMRFPKKPLQWPPSKAYGDVGRALVAERKLALAQLRRDTRAAIAKAREAGKSLREELTAAKPEARRLKAGEARIGQPGLQGRIFPQEVADELDRAFSDRAAKWLRNMGEVNAVARLMSTGFDFAAGMIQGIPLLGTNLPAWARAQGRAMQALLNPRAYEAFLAKRSATRQEMALHNVPMSIAEQVEAAMPGGALFKATAKVRYGLAKPVEFTAKRAAIAFNAFGDVARMELWEALKPVAQRTGRPGALMELGDFISKMTGVSGRRKLGLSATQQEMERSLFFATRYYRASAGLMADVVQGGLRGELARNALAKMTAAGLIYYYGICLALGQKPEINPASGRFLNFKFPGTETQVGPGSIWRAMARLLGGIYGQVERDPDGLTPLSIPKAVKDQVSVQGRYRLSPMLGYGWDVIVGKTAIGKPIDRQFDVLGMEAARRFLPFAVQDYLPDMSDSEFEEPRPHPISLISELGGLRVSPTSLFQQRRERREGLAGPRGWESLTGFERQQIEEQDLPLRQLDEKVRAWGLERGDDLDKLRVEFFSKGDQFRDERKQAIFAAEDAIRKRRGTGKEFRDRVSAIGATLRDKYDSLRDDERFQPLLAEFQLWQERAVGEDRPVDDVVYDEYLQEIVLAGDLEDALGNYNYIEAERRKRKIAEKYGEKAYERLEVRLQHGLLDMSPMMQELHRGRDLFGPYWNVGAQLATQQGILELWDEWRNYKHVSRGEEILEANPTLKEIDKTQTRVRQKMRDESPALDAFLYKYGFSTTLRNVTTEALGKAIVEHPDFDVLALPMVNA